MEVIDTGMCGFRKIRIIKTVDNLDINKDHGDIAIAYVVQINCPVLLFFNKWISIMCYGYLSSIDSNEADINRSDLLSKMSAKALFNNMVKYGKF